MTISMVLGISFEDMINTMLDTIRVAASKSSPMMETASG